ncbi:hypothetical protein D3C72_1998420 [compost metagenome]
MPPAAGSSVRLTPSADAVAWVTLLPSLNVMPCLANAFCRVLAVSSSVPGQIRSRYSMTVTWLPRRRHTEPNSRPITPAPITIRCLGTSGNDKAPVESMMR